MNFRPRTSSEINIFRIERNLKKLKDRTITVQEAGLNKRFDRLKRDNPWMWDDLYPRYVEIVRSISMLSLI